MPRISPDTGNDNEPKSVLSGRDGRRRSFLAETLSALGGVLGRSEARRLGGSSIAQGLTRRQPNRSTPETPAGISSVFLREAQASCSHVSARSTKDEALMEKTETVTPRIRPSHQGGLGRFHAPSFFDRDTDEESCYSSRSSSPDNFNPLNANPVPSFPIHSRIVYDTGGVDIEVQSEHDMNALVGTASGKSRFYRPNYNVHRNKRKDRSGGAATKRSGELPWSFAKQPSVSTLLKRSGNSSLSSVMGTATPNSPLAGASPHKGMSLPPDKTAAAIREKAPVPMSDYLSASPREEGGGTRRLLTIDFNSTHHSNWQSAGADAGEADGSVLTACNPRQGFMDFDTAVSPRSPSWGFAGGQSKSRALRPTNQSSVEGSRRMDGGRPASGKSPTSPPWQRIGFGRAFGSTLEPSKFDGSKLLFDGRPRCNYPSRRPERRLPPFLSTRRPPEKSRYYYFGEVRNGKRHGWGTLVNHQRILYEGQWKSGKGLGWRLIHHEFSVEIGRGSPTRDHGVIIVGDKNMFVLPCGQRLPTCVGRRVPRGGRQRQRLHSREASKSAELRGQWSPLFRTSSLETLSSEPAIPIPSQASTLSYSPYLDGTASRMAYRQRPLRDRSIEPHRKLPETPRSAPSRQWNVSGSFADVRQAWFGSKATSLQGGTLGSKEGRPVFYSASFEQPAADESAGGQSGLSESKPSPSWRLRRHSSPLSVPSNENTARLSSSLMFSTSAAADTDLPVRKNSGDGEPGKALGSGAVFLPMESMAAVPMEGLSNSVSVDLGHIFHDPSNLEVRDAPAASLLRRGATFPEACGSGSHEGLARCAAAAVALPRSASWSSSIFKREGLCEDGGGYARGRDGGGCLLNSGFVRNATEAPGWLRAADSGRWTPSQLSLFLRMVGSPNEAAICRKRGLGGADICRLTEGVLIEQFGLAGNAPAQRQYRKFLLAVFRYLYSCMDRCDALMASSRSSASNRRSVLARDGTSLPLINENDLKFGKKIGSGGYADVYQASLRGEKVACKVFTYTPNILATRTVWGEPRGDRVEAVRRGISEVSGSDGDTSGATESPVARVGSSQGSPAEVSRLIDGNPQREGMADAVASSLNSFLARPSKFSLLPPTNRKPSGGVEAPPLHRYPSSAPDQDPPDVVVPPNPHSKSAIPENLFVSKAWSMDDWANSTTSSIPEATDPAPLNSLRSCEGTPDPPGSPFFYVSADGSPAAPIVDRTRLSGGDLEMWTSCPSTTAACDSKERVKQPYNDTTMSSSTYDETGHGQTNSTCDDTHCGRSIGDESRHGRTSSAYDGTPNSRLISLPDGSCLIKTSSDEGKSQTHRNEDSDDVILFFSASSVSSKGVSAKSLSPRTGAPKCSADPASPLRRTEDQWITCGTLADSEAPRRTSMKKLDTPPSNTSRKRSNERARLSSTEEATGETKEEAMPRTVWFFSDRDGGEPPKQQNEARTPQGSQQRLDVQTSTAQPIWQSIEPSSKGLADSPKQPSSAEPAESLQHSSLQSPPQIRRHAAPHATFPANAVSKSVLREADDSSEATDFGQARHERRAATATPTIRINSKAVLPSMLSFGFLSQGTATTASPLSTSPSASLPLSSALASNSSSRSSVEFPGEVRDARAASPCDPVEARNSAAVHWVRSAGSKRHLLLSAGKASTGRCGGCGVLTKRQPLPLAAKRKNGWTQSEPSSDPFASEILQRFCSKLASRKAHSFIQRRRIVSFCWTKPFLLSKAKRLGLFLSKPLVAWQRRLPSLAGLPACQEKTEKTLPPTWPCVDGPGSEDPQWQQQPSSLRAPAVHTSICIDTYRYIPTPMKHRNIEAEIIASLQGSPYVVKLYGITQIGSSAAGLVLEHCSRGSLDNLVLRPEARRENAVWRPLDRPRVIFMFEQIAVGMSFVHQQKILHRDLKLSNILVDELNNIRIADFGIARRYGPKDSPSALAVYGNVYYAAPEVLRGDGFFPQSDVWSFGVAMWEALTGRLAFEGIVAGAVFTQLAAGTLELPIPTDLPRALQHILKNALQFDWRRRPTFATLAEELHQLRGGTVEMVASEMESFFGI